MSGQDRQPPRYFIPTQDNPHRDVFERLPVPGHPELTIVVNQTATHREQIAALRKLAAEAKRKS